MDSADIQVGSTIHDGFRAVRVTERVVEHVVRNGRHEVVKGWRGLAIPISGQPAMPIVGSASYVEDAKLHWWRHVPFEWKPTPLTEKRVEERYVWDKPMTKLIRESRTTR